VDYLAVQLGVVDASVVKRYTEREKTAYEHAWEISRAYGYRDVTDGAAVAGLREFTDGRAWIHAEGPMALFGQAVAWLRRHRVRPVEGRVQRRPAMAARRRLPPGRS